MNSAVQFLPYDDTHFDACMGLFDANCPAFFAPNEKADYQVFLKRVAGKYRVVILGGNVVGAFGVLDEAISGRCRLNWIVVDASNHGSGVGRSIMAETVAAARQMRAEVVEIAASDKSAPFFAKFGARELNYIAHGWGLDMHRIDMELAVATA